MGPESASLHLYVITVESSCAVPRNQTPPKARKRTGTGNPQRYVPRISSTVPMVRSMILTSRASDRCRM
jgi:hypothetical protein